MTAFLPAEERIFMFLDVGLCFKLIEPKAVASAPGIDVIPHRREIARFELTKLIRR